MILENPQPGDRVTWRSLNRNSSGTVEAVDPRRGALVAVDGGGYVIISTASSMAALKKKYER
jgi:hypothetical protein